ncbi:Uncharacterised protein [Slackia heliotrinireducens]|uniref:Uncharacterized protein n=1 Tax=Slackia heliotrinireducens (strain ATCC 29202 / DSM 20476 / NCTC 11029 / RHS 1) TaxID=471855 RepID=C7N503_SLAHD|nr:hypothetical protein [Slackia heliotrinireducens]ACV21988.1 hypothetical protein Shel_09480 [Slackia heliotrinireducens DSM 20476]VEG99878.1 Uncharacterised protein [Slackia heliotrinireducens]
MRFSTTPTTQKTIHENLPKYEKKFNGENRNPVHVLACSTEGIRRRLVLCTAAIEALPSTTEHPDTALAVHDSLLECMDELEGMARLLEDLSVERDAARS